MAQNPPHAVADELLGPALAGVVPTGYHVRGAKPVRLPGRGNEPEPDRCVVRGSSRDDEDHHPGPDDFALIAEVADGFALFSAPEFLWAGMHFYSVVASDGEQEDEGGREKHRRDGRECRQDREGMG
jgi:hypothetical protein